jgi:chaperonin GroES
MNIKPVNDRVLIKPIEAEKQTAGGIFIPTTLDESTTQGTVVSVGPGKLAKDGKVIPLHVSEGDTVLFPKNSGHEVKVENSTYIVLTEDQIFAIMDNKE